MTDPLAPFTRWDTARLVGRQLGLAGDMFLAVVGAGMFALSAVVFMDGFGFVTNDLTQTTGAMLGAGLVIAVVGLFALGVASEGPMTGEAYAYPELELAISRAVGVTVVSVLGLVLSSVLAPLANGISLPFELGVAVIRAVSVAGLIMVLPVGVPTTWYLRRELPVSRVGWDRLILLVTWIVTSWVALGSTV